MGLAVLRRSAALEQVVDDRFRNTLAQEIKTTLCGEPVKQLLIEEVAGQLHRPSVRIDKGELDMDVSRCDPNEDTLVAWELTVYLTWDCKVDMERYIADAFAEPLILQGDPSSLDYEGVDRFRLRGAKLYKRTKDSELGSEIKLTLGINRKP